MSTQCQSTVKRFRVDSISWFAVRCWSVGSRLERGTPMPKVKESYESEQEAQIATAKHTQMNTKAREGQPSAANAVVQSA